MTAAATSITGLVAQQWPFIVTIILASAVAWILPQILKKDPLSKIPFAGAEYGDAEKRRLAFFKNSKQIYLEAYAKFAGGTFLVNSGKNMKAAIVIHPRYLPELKDLPEDTINFAAAIDDTMHAEHTKLRSDRPIIPHVVKKHLTPALNRLNPAIAEEVDQSIREELPPCDDDFAPVVMVSALLRIVAKVSGAVFIGTELCRSEEYIEAAINYTMDVMKAVNAVDQLPPNQRSANGASLPQVKLLAEREIAATQFMRPIIEAREAAKKNDPDWQAPDDLLQWVMDGGQSVYGDQGATELAAIQLSLTFAAIHTTTLTATNAVYTLVSMPEIIPEIRQEISDVLKEYGTFTTAALQKMKKLDSFMRETMRFYPLSWVSFNRKALKDFTLSNGQVIPANTNIEIPKICINFDPEYIENPQEFDAFRFYRARDSAGAGAANQFVSVSPANLTFGYGRHACPGRFFAANEIKMIVSRFILDYDMKPEPGTTARYPNNDRSMSSAPDGTRKIYFKRVAV